MYVEEQKQLIDNSSLEYIRLVNELVEEKKKSSKQKKTTIEKSFNFHDNGQFNLFHTTNVYVNINVNINARIYRNIKKIEKYLYLILIFWFIILSILVL